MQDIGRQFSIAWRWLPLIIIATLFVGFMAFVVANDQPEVYEASAQLIVEPGPNPSVSDLTVAEELASQDARLAVTRDVASAVIAATGLDIDPADLQEVISVESELGSTIIEIDARDGDPARAVAMAAAMAEQLVERAAMAASATGSGTVDVYLDSIRDEIARDQDRLGVLLALPARTPAQVAETVELQGRLAERQANYADLLPFSSVYQRNQLVLFESPTEPTSPVEPRPVFWAILASVAMLIGITAIVFIVEYVGGWVRSEADAEEATGLPFLGMVNERRGDVRSGPQARLVMLLHPGSRDAGAYRSLVAAVDSAKGPLRSLVVAGAAPAKAKSAVAANLAIAWAQSGRNVLLVDGDLLNPSLHEYFGVPNEGGVSSMLDYGAMAVAAASQPTMQPNLRVLTSGPSSRSPVEAGAGWAGHLMGRLLAEVDLIIIDSPEVPTYSVAPVLGASSQGLLLVVDRGTRRGVLAEATKMLEVGRGNVIGTILSQRVRGRRSGGRQDRAQQNVQHGSRESGSPQAPDPSYVMAGGAGQVNVEARTDPGPYALTEPDSASDPGQGADGTAAHR